MKKLLLLFITAGTLISGCGKDNSGPELKLNQDEVKLNYDKEFQFIIENGYVTSWTSSDEFVGIIESNGTFKAKHIGETTITAIVNGKSITAKVIVEPKVTEIIEPLYGSEITSVQVKNYEKRKLLSELSDGTIIYQGSSRYEGIVMYLFEKEKWSGSMVGLETSPTDISNKTSDFILERYLPYLKIENVLFFTSKDGNTIIGLGASTSTGVSLSYIPNANKKSLQAFAEKSNKSNDIVKSIISKIEKIQ